MRLSGKQPVMIVEDSDDDYEATERALTRDGRLTSPLLRFESGEAALSYLLNETAEEDAEHPVLPRIILLDLNLPGLGGAHTLSQIKSRPELTEIPIVILTTSNDPGDIHRCYQAGANTYIQKPVSYDQYFSAVQQLRDYWLDLALLPGEAR